MTHTLLHLMNYSGLCKNKRDVCAFFLIAWQNTQKVSLCVCMYVVGTRLQPSSRNVKTWNFVRMFKRNLYRVIFFFKFLISRLISPLTRKIGFSVGTHLKAKKNWSTFIWMCWNHVYINLYCKWAKSENYDVIKFRAKNNPKSQNCRRKLKIDSNDAKSQAHSENV